MKHRQTIADVVSAQDRAYFEQHPTATRYVRKAVVGELGPPVEIYAGAMVIVTQLRPGARHRRLIRPVQVGSS